MQFKQAVNLVQQMGPAWVAGRASYSVQRKLGWLEKRCPARQWTAYRWADIAPDVPAERLRDLLNNEIGTKFFLRPALRETYQTHLQQLITPDAAARLHYECASLKRGEWRFFSGLRRDVGWPARWHIHPETGDEWPLTHWSRIADLGGSDVKWLWELGRFMPTYALLRAYWLTGDATHAETFWELVESWRDANPPNQGAHWMCGQECAFRILAWLFGLFGFLDAPATTDARLIALMEMLTAHGERIEGNIGYALAQKNNHGVNEALGLWLLGVLFPFLPRAARWAAKGRRLLLREARRQIYDDGAYIQQSINYHRLALQSYTVALRVGELCGQPFPTELHERCQRAADWLWQSTDAHAGGTPNYGSNDGAVLFRLDDAGFSDYRAGAEQSLWLHGPEVSPQFPPQHELASDIGGYYTIRGQETWAFMRCGVYLDRPAQADMLHADIWWRGHNIIADPGTYSYNSPAPWNNGLTATRVHNTLTVDDLDQMERGPRFTWFFWTRGRVVRREKNLFVGEHTGYQARLGVVHRRTILLREDWLWVIVDDLQGAGEHTLAAHWLMPAANIVAQDSAAFHVRWPVGEGRLWFATFAPAMAHPTQFELFNGPSDDTRGWFAPRYLQKEAAPGLVAQDLCTLPARRVTVLALGAENFVGQFAKLSQLPLEYKPLNGAIGTI